MSAIKTTVWKMPAPKNIESKPKNESENKPASEAGRKKGVRKSGNSKDKPAENAANK